jgi:hypothetical protein
MSSLLRYITPPIGEGQVVEEESSYNEAYKLILVVSSIQLCGAAEIIFSLFYYYLFSCKTLVM